MNKLPLAKWNFQTKNELYKKKTVQPPLLNWFNRKNASGSDSELTEMVQCRNDKVKSWMDQRAVTFIAMPNGPTNGNLVQRLDTNGSE